MISIIVPVYNVAVYLRQCIESLLNQTYKNIEVVLVNDGSTDGGGDICEEFRRKDPRVVVLHKENGGLVSARKAGLKASRGRYIACVDGDDWIEPDMYERMHCRMTEKNVDIVMCGHTHKPVVEIDHDITLINPGSISYPRQDNRRPSYVIMEIDREGEAHYTINYLG